MARTEVLRLRVRVAWWVRLYLKSVATFAILTGQAPDIGKVGYWVQRGIRIEVN